MQLHQIKPIHKLIQKKRIGRGGRKGFHCGRGTKGQTMRSTNKLQPLIRQIIKRYPKLRGYKFKPRLKPAVLNIDDLEKKFQHGETIDPKILIERKLVRRIKGKIPQVKILGEGKITKSLTVEGCQVSKSAKEKIEKAGGKIK